MKLTDTQKAFAYASYVLDALGEAGACLPYLEIYSDTSCSLVLPEDDYSDIYTLAEKLLHSNRWESQPQGFIKLTSCGGLMQGAKEMFVDDRG